MKQGPDASTSQPTGRRLRHAGDGRGDLFALAVTLAGLAVAIGLGLASQGFYHDDDIGHYLFARSAWTDAKAVWHLWARPGYNVPAMFVVHFFGMTGCRVFSAVQTAIMAYLAYLIARRLIVSGPGWGKSSSRGETDGSAMPAPGRSGGMATPRAGRPWCALLAPALVWAQPLAMTLAHTTLTETPAGLYLTLAVWLYLRGNRIGSCAVMSLVFVTRTETMAMAPILAAAVVYDALRQSQFNVGRMLRAPFVYGAAMAMLWAPALWAAAAVRVGLPPAGSPLGMFFRGYSTEYGCGPWHHFLMAWTEACGAGVVALAAAGAVHLGRRAWLVTAMAFGLVAVHTVLFHFGLFASGGYARFLIPASGLVAAMAAGGVDGLLRGRPRVAMAGVVALPAAAGLGVARVLPLVPARLLMAAFGVLVAIPAAALAFGRGSGWRRLGQAAAVTALLAVMVQTGLQIRPLGMGGRMHRLVTAATRELDNGPYCRHRVLTTHVLVSFLRDNTTIVFNVADAEKRWKRAAPGTLFLWDSKYGGAPTAADPVSPLYSELNRRGRRIVSRGDGSHRAEVFLRLPDTPTTASAAMRQGA